MGDQFTNASIFPACLAWLDAQRLIELLPTFSYAYADVLGGMIGMQAFAQAAIFCVCLQIATMVPLHQRLDED